MMTILIDNLTKGGSLSCLIFRQAAKLGKEGGLYNSETGTVYGSNLFKKNFQMSLGSEKIPPRLWLQINELCMLVSEDLLVEQTGF